MTTKDDKLKAIREIEKEEIIHTLLAEILPELGFNDVHVTHERGNKSENGKDLICSYEDKIEGKKDWLAFVVKKGTVAGTSSVIQDIIAQTKDCFDYEYKDIIKGLRIRINKVKVVTNKHFSAEAKSKIEGNTNFKSANISFWDAEKLVELIDAHYPQYWLKGSKAYKKYVEKFNEIIQTESISKTIGISNKKIQKIIACAIEPKITERVENEDGTFIWKEKNAHTIINLPHNSIIIGEPGAGKTTLFKGLSKEIIEQNSLRHNSEFYPIILTFQDLATFSFDLEKSVKNYFRKDWNSDLNIDADQILLERNCVIFIDALDELPKKEQKQSALEAITTFYSKFPEIKIICSSRPSDYLFYNCSELGFKYLEINPLNKKQVELFLTNYFSDNVIKSQRLLKSLKDTAILDKLPKTPLTIALITILFEEKEIEIPATITDLYEQFVGLLLGKYNPENTIEIIEIGIKHRLLCYIAKSLHTDKKQSTSIIELKVLLTEYSKQRGQNFDIELILEDLINNSGLLFINEKNEIQFKHLSFQEYFTAYEIFHHRQSDVSLFSKNFNNLWWQNVCIFYAGMTKDAPSLLADIIKDNSPKNFGEYLINTAGLGKLMQALYNTPIDKRMAGIEQGINNTATAIQFLIGTEDETFKIWKNFSKYGLLQLIGSLFQFSNWSITLVEPLKQQFDLLIKKIDEERDADEQFYFEFKLYLICSILASDDFISFGEFRNFVEKTKANDLTLLAIMDMHLQNLDKHLSAKNKEDEDYLKAEKKVRTRLRQIGNIADKVNIPINKKLIETK